MDKLRCILMLICVLATSRAFALDIDFDQLKQCLNSSVPFVTIQGDNRVWVIEGHQVFLLHPQKTYGVLPSKKFPSLAGYCFASIDGIFYPESVDSKTEVCKNSGTVGFEPASDKDIGEILESKLASYEFRLADAEKYPNHEGLLASGPVVKRNYPAFLACKEVGFHSKAFDAHDLSLQEKYENYMKKNGLQTGSGPKAPERNTTGDQ